MNRKEEKKERKKKWHNEAADVHCMAIMHAAIGMKGGVMDY
jgi:hypothetical protein